MYCSPNMNAKTSSGGTVPVISILLGSILRQLYAQLPRDKHVEAVRKRYMESRFDGLRTDEIKDGIRGVVQNFTRAYIVVDGLDECSGIPGDDLEDLCQFFGSLAAPELLDSICVVIFSRSGYAAITHAFPDVVEIRVDDGSNASDIKAFIEDKTMGLAKKPSALQQIRGSLLYSADGVFLWVALSIKVMEMETTDRTKMVAAQHMERGLEQLYLMILQRILAQPTSSCDLALKAFLWLTYSREPLSKKEMIHALSFQPGMVECDNDDLIDENIVLSSCAGLVAVKDNQFQLLHFSLAEFLMSDAAVDAIYSKHPRVKDEEPDAVLATICMSYILLDELRLGPVETPNGLEGLAERYPLLPHAAKHWGIYLRRSQSLKNIDLACRILRNSRSRNFVIQALHFFDPLENRQARFGRPESVQVLHVLAAFGLQDLLGWFPEAVTQLDLPDEFSWHPIDYAIAHGHEAMSRWLLSRGRIMKPPTPSASSINHHEETAIQPLSRHIHLALEAAKHKWADMMSSVVVAGFDDHGDILFPRRSKRDLIKPCEALDVGWHEAASSGDMDAAEELIKSGADTNIRNRFGVTPLMTAARRSDISMVKQLLDCGADVNMQTYDGATALHFVASRFEGNAGADIICLLCDRGANTEKRNDAGATALLDAAEHDNPGAIQALLSKGANLPARDRTHSNLLHMASKHGSSQVLKFLLDERNPDNIELKHVADSIAANITSLFCADKEGRWPLHHAVVSGNVECAGYVCDLDSDQVNKEDGDGYTPLYLATLGSEVPMIDVLLDRGADWNIICGSTDYTPLHLAMTGLPLDVATALLGRGADPNLKNTAGMSPWDIAAIHGDQTTMRFVLDHDLLLQEDEDQLQRLLSMAVGHQNVDVVSLLLSPYGQYSLLSDAKLDRDLGLTAVWGGSLEIWQMLVSRDSSLAVETDSTGLDAPHYAAMFGRTNFIGHFDQMDFDRLNEAESCSNEQSPLIWAAKCGMSGMVQALCNKGVHVNHVDSYGRTAMHYAAGLGCRDSVESLLQAGADVSARDIAGFTAAEYANSTVAASLGGGVEGLQFPSPPCRIEEAREAITSVIQRLCSPEVPAQTAAPSYDKCSDLGLVRMFLLKLGMFPEAALVSTSLLEEGLRCCDICGVDIEGLGFYHCAECADVDLCASCHRIFVRGRGHGGQLELEALEQAMQPVRRALQDVSQFGINTLLQVIDRAGGVLWGYFAEIEEQYRRWSKHRYNLEEQQEQQTPGWVLVGIINDLKYLRYYESSTGASEDDTAPVVSGPRERQLTYNFRLLNRDYSPARERPRFACCSHTFLEIHSIEQLPDEDRAFFDENGALSSAFWVKLGDAIASLDLTQVAAETEHKFTSWPVESTPEKMCRGEGSIEIVEVRESLLRKMKSFRPDDDSLARGEGMVLETAWSLVQAVVYGDETRFPTLTELMEDLGK